MTNSDSHTPNCDLNTPTGLPTEEGRTELSLWAPTSGLPHPAWLYEIVQLVYHREIRGHARQ